jgi:hypothetical protein
MRHKIEVSSAPAVSCFGAVKHGAIFRYAGISATYMKLASPKGKPYRLEAVNLQTGDVFEINDTALVVPLPEGTDVKITVGTEEFYA